MRLMSENTGHVLGMAPRPTAAIDSATEPGRTGLKPSRQTRVIFPGFGVYSGEQFQCDFYSKKTSGGVESQIHRPFKDKSQDFQEMFSWLYPREPIDPSSSLGVQRALVARCEEP